MKKFLTLFSILFLAVFFISCECGHTSSDKQERLYVDDTALCTGSRKLENGIDYYFGGSIVPSKITKFVNPKVETCCPITVGHTYHIRYSYWKCEPCNRAGKYKVQDVLVMEEVNGLFRD